MIQKSKTMEEYFKDKLLPVICKSGDQFIMCEANKPIGEPIAICLSPTRAWSFRSYRSLAKDANSVQRLQPIDGMKWEQPNFDDFVKIVECGFRLNRILELLKGDKISKTYLSSSRYGNCYVCFCVGDQEGLDKEFHFAGIRNLQQYLQINTFFYDVVVDVRPMISFE